MKEHSRLPWYAIWMLLYVYSCMFPWVFSIRSNPATLILLLLLPNSFPGQLREEDNQTQMYSHSVSGEGVIQSSHEFVYAQRILGTCPGLSSIQQRKDLCFLCKHRCCYGLYLPFSFSCQFPSETRSSCILEDHLLIFQCPPSLRAFPLTS